MKPLSCGVKTLIDASNSKCKSENMFIREKRRERKKGKMEKTVKTKSSKCKSEKMFIREKRREREKKL